MDLEQLRRGIDKADESLLDILAQRRKLTRQAVQLKVAQNMPIRDVEREEALLGRLADQARGRQLDPHLVVRLYQQILDDSLRAQNTLRQLEPVSSEFNEAIRVAYQGVEGSYSDEASQRYFQPLLERTELVGCRTVAAVGQAVENGNAEFGLLPIENNTAGSINEVYDLLIRRRLHVVGETVLRVEHCLVGHPGTAIGSLRKVLSHWQALAQCGQFLETLPSCRAEPFEDTALAVRKVHEDGDQTAAAIASEEAARRYGLVVLARGIANDRANRTRFLVVASQPIEVPIGVAAKTSLVMAVSHRPGALYRSLEALERQRINLTKLESRPQRGTHFEYFFFLDFEGSMAEQRVRRAVESLRANTRFLQVLGSYPAWSQTAARPVLNPPPKATGGEGHQTGEATSTPGATAPSYKLASRNGSERNTVVPIGNVEVGGGELVVIAGPCSVESEAQIEECARQVKEEGGGILRGGCFKPRTSPYSFQGLGFEGLELLAAAGRRHGLPVVTEVLAAEDAERIAEVADMLQIGARNMQNFHLLSAVGRLNRPVLLKRGLSASLEEFLNAAEYVLSQGNQQVVLCERGIRTFETMTRNTLDLAGVSLLKRLTHLPIVIDTSHAAGRRELVRPLTEAAVAVRPHGLMVEIHPRPDEALSDGAQALPFAEFGELMADIRSPEQAREL